MMLPEIAKNRMVMTITASPTVASCIGATPAVCIGAPSVAAAAGVWPRREARVATSAANDCAVAQSSQYGKSAADFNAVTSRANVTEVSPVLPTSQDIPDWE